MTGSHPNPATPASDTERTARIRAEVNAACNALRDRHPWLRHQDAIGLGIMLMSAAGMGLCA
ncbi:MAG: fatty acid desaturase, partial [Gammaproteobacteria bacterium]